MITEQKHSHRKSAEQIGHIVTTCPDCGVNNFWTKSVAIDGENYYYQRCSSCGYKEI